MKLADEVSEPVERLIIARENVDQTLKFPRCRDDARHPARVHSAKTFE